MSLSDQALEGALSSALGQPVKVKARRPLGGGCINNAERLSTSAGAFFLKWNPKPLPGLFAQEASALKALRAADSGLRIPAPITFRDQDRGKGEAPGFLILEHLEPGPKIKDFDERLGRGLAQLHRQSAQGFGFMMPTYCGESLQPNPWTEDWIEFYREHRLRHQLRMAQGLLGPDEARRFERLLDRLEALLGASRARPSLIHGDLWSGNLHTGPKGEPALIDPAAYFAHREAELGMMRLFGGFSSRVHDAYQEAWPLEAGFEARLPLYELYHVINHANLFGGGYVAQAMRIVDRHL